MIGRPAPIAAAIACSTMKTSLAPAWRAESFTARFSTCVMSDGTEMTIFGRTKSERPWAFLMK